MPSGAAVIPYRGKRGTTWRIKFLDADGRQIMETLGSERDGWTHRKAEAELRERLVRVERQGYRRPRRLTFDEYPQEWLEGYEAVTGAHRLLSLVVVRSRASVSSSDPSRSAGSSRVMLPSTSSRQSSASHRRP